MNVVSKSAQRLYPKICAAAHFMSDSPALAAEKKADVCVIIVNYNAGDFIERCLDAVAAQTLPPRRVIVVDNGSSDGSIERVEQGYPGIRVLRLGRNTGFAAANNRAVEQAGDAAWIALLNPDAYPGPRWLEALLAAARDHPDCAAFGSRLLRADDPDVIDGDGDIYHVAGGAWRCHHGVATPQIGDTSAEVFSPCAAAALYRRDAFLEVGGFDESYFCYLEDVDLGFRLRLQGHYARQVADAPVLHEGSGVTGAESDFSLYHIQRNLIWTYLKNMPLALLLRYLPAHLLLNLLGLLALVRRGRGGLVLRAKLDALRGLPALLRARRKVQAGRTVHDADLLAAMARGLTTPYRRDKRLQS